MPRFTEMHKTTFGEILTGWEFYVGPIEPDLDEPTTMKQLIGPYRKMKAKAHVLGRTDVDMNVKLPCAWGQDGTLFEFAADESVWVHRQYLQEDDDIPF